MCGKLRRRNGGRRGVRARLQGDPPSYIQRFEESSNTRQHIRSARKPRSGSGRAKRRRSPPVYVDFTPRPRGRWDQSLRRSDIRAQGLGECVMARHRMFLAAFLVQPDRPTGAARPKRPLSCVRSGSKGRGGPFCSASLFRLRWVRTRGDRFVGVASETEYKAP
jgi:hypothetical protein